MKDDTGALTVFAQTAAPPPRGDTAGVKGVFQALLTIGSKSFAVLQGQSRL